MDVPGPSYVQEIREKDTRFAQEYKQHDGK